MSITIRTLHTAAELEAAVELQKIYWGEDMADLVPYHMLLSFSRYGGHIHGAFDEERMIGLLMGFLGAAIATEGNEDAPSRLYVMSKRMVVLPDYRGKKIGEDLKLAQKKFALRHNIQLVTWTFDPLLSRNAYLNIHKLGAIGQHYIEDYFGTGGKNPVLSADRLEVNWWVQHPHMQQRESQNAANSPIINQLETNSEGFLVPQSFRLVDSDILRLEIPAEFQPIVNMDSGLSQTWRNHIRQAFQALLGNGYLATDFIRVENRVFYVFSLDDGSYDFKY